MATRAATKKAGTNMSTASTKRTNGGKTARTEPVNGKGTGEARPPAVNGNGQPKLGKGGLGSLVTEFLVTHPKAEVTPTELGNKLSRSSGAVANALERLVMAGKAVRTSDRPRRYRHKPAKATKQAKKA